MRIVLWALLMLGILLAAFEAHFLLGVGVLLWMAWISALAWDHDPSAITTWESEGGYISLLDDTKVHRCWNCNRPIPIAAKRCRHCGVSQSR
jgi:hypothetical protein